MPRVKCDNCGAGVDVTKDGKYGHCASCNTIVELKKKDDKEGRPKNEEEKKEAEKGSTQSTGS